MRGSIERIDAAAALPDAWDAMARNIFQRREFLVHCEKYNPCAQRYYLLVQNGGIAAGAIVYTLGLDLLTFLKIKSPVRMHVAGVPCSVSSSGIVGEVQYHRDLLAGIVSIEKGFFLCLNIGLPPENSRLIAGRTWPTIEFVNNYSSWEAYCRSLRSSYRRRLRQTEDAARKLTIRSMPCRGNFPAGLYPLYEAVHRRSSGKLEKLSCDFFADLPKAFTLTTFASRSEVIGWTITVPDCNGCFYFFLGGQDYSHDPVNVYNVKLIGVLRAGIESGACRIDLGQSAEVPKMRFGGLVREKYMLAHFGNPIGRSLLRMGRGLLSYNRRFPATNCFVKDPPC